MSEARPLTAGDLKRLLANVPDDRPILLQVDPEGNGYHHLYHVDDRVICPDVRDYRPENVMSMDWSADGAGMTADGWDKARATQPRCCVLAP